MDSENIYDVIVAGSGPGGMTAALYASRANMTTLILERGAPGGQLINTAEIENYTGYKSIPGPDLASKMYEGALNFGADYQYGDIQDLVDHGSYKEIKASGKSYYARAVIIATGAEHKKLGVPGEESFNGRGVSYCAVCDGAFFKGKDIVVVGGGDSAVEEGNYLTQFADQVSIIHRRDELRAQRVLQDRAFNNDKIDFIWDSVVEEIMGDDSVSKVRLRNVKTGEVRELDTNGTFIYIGLVPNSQAFANLGICDDQGWVLTDEKMETKVPGIFAIGDVRQTVLRQVATAVGDGAVAGNEAFNYVEGLKDSLTKEKVSQSSKEQE